MISPLRPLKILLVYDCVYPESLGGVEHRNYHLAKVLAERGHSVTLAGWSKEAKQLFPGVKVLPLPFEQSLYNSAGKRSAFVSLRFAAAVMSLKFKQFDVIETANIPYIHILPLALGCAIARKPLIVTWHEYWGRYWREYTGSFTSVVFRGIEYFCAQLGKEVNAVSQLTAKRLQDHRLGSGKITIIPNGVSLKQIQKASDRVERDAPPLVYAGRLIREKRIDLLLEALARISLPQEKVILTIIGDGPDRQRLEILTEQLGIEGRVNFMGRLSTNDDVWHQLARAKVAVQPSSREGFGMFPLEAMAVGLPVIYCESSESAISGLVGDGIEGICTKPDTAALADAIESLLGDPQRSSQLSENAWKKAQSYDWTVVAQQMEVLFGRAMQQEALDR